MALSNRDRIDGCSKMAAPLDDFIASVVGQGDPELGAVWTKLVQAKDVKNGATGDKIYDPLDPPGLSSNRPRATSLAASRLTGTPSTRPSGRLASHSPSNCVRSETPGRTTALSAMMTPTAPSAPASGTEADPGAMKKPTRSTGIRLNLRRVTADKDGEGPQDGCRQS